MFDLIGIRTAFKDAHGSGGYYTQKVDIEEVVATFDSKENARTYIKISQLKSLPPVHSRTWEKRPFKKRSLLFSFGRATIRKSVYKPPLHNPTL